MAEIDQTAQDMLRSYIARIERLEEEKAGIADDIKAVYAEAKSNGLDPKIMRQVVKLRGMKAEERREQEMLLDTYLAALGMLADTPLGEAAVDREFSGTTVRIGDGPEIPFEAVERAADMLNTRAGRKAIREAAAAAE